MGCARYCAVSVGIAVSVAGSATKLIQVYVNILTPTSMENATHFARRPQTDAQQQQPVWGGEIEKEGVGGGGGGQAGSLGPINCELYNESTLRRFY